MAQRYWSCRRCGFRNLRTASPTCGSCGYRTKPKARKPAHEHALEMTFEQYAVLQAEVHGLDEFTCAICGKPGREGLRLQRDHAHFDGGYARGLVHALCNKRLGEVERGQDGLVWMQAAMRYLERSAEAWRRRQEAA